MKGLIVTISVALLISRSPCEASPNLSPTGQQSTNDAIMNGAPTPVATNTTRATNSTYGNQVAGVNSTSALNPTAAPVNATAVTGSTNGTTVMGNSYSLNSTASSIYVMERDINWTDSNFSVYNQNGTVSYHITNRYAGANLTAKEFIVQDAITGQKKLKIDSRVKACGFGQTYEADDGTTFRLDPRAFLSDRWYIKNESSDYTYKRSALSMDGKILENERIVAQVTTRTNTTATSGSTKQLTVTSDGSIRPWDLIALMAIAKTRIATCGY
ncbi:hypothetical protein PGT21_021490 [Puccinia graminis f. sp. tritici]|uniref:Uncharacterized protein n=2 Tax=Puccinia graminis f. sp. tritici TaxID=56615 RepID=E3KRA5_PUCGT|nr:uncharacterized protein PGTG_13212 [Puccinia graminis f. sp. tritici CRL 75-36-700-3]EFP86830.1 hypothetical protein PGTG_13212 [Puccinia graminis f. sp. tritici CRL 75-36-700-3]KAA1077832.1 hypothetical protein PGT21_021490 [Puccinia graminis f. sp. tritici]